MFEANSYTVCATTMQVEEQSSFMFAKIRCAYPFGSNMSVSIRDVTKTQFEGMVQMQCTCEFASEASNNPERRKVMSEQITNLEKLIMGIPCIQEGEEPKSYSSEVASVTTGVLSLGSKAIIAKKGAEVGLLVNEK